MTYRLYRVLSWTIFAIALLICLAPAIDAPIALLIGVIVAQIIRHPFNEQNDKIISWLLKTSVVGLGFGMNVYKAIEAGKEGFALTITSITITLLAGWLIGRRLKVENKISLLVSSGTAICGGSAIAAISQIVGTNEKQTGVALGAIFILNSLALITFPAIGHWIAMTPHQFGMWCAIAIHDTSSVIGASAKFGQEALQIATTIKLERALWIIPLSLLIITFSKDVNKKISPPYFIGLFILSMCLSTSLPQFSNYYLNIVMFSKKALTVTLFLVGTGLSIEKIKSTGIRPLLMGALLWIFISAISLLVIMVV